MYIDNRKFEESMDRIMQTLEIIVDKINPKYKVTNEIGGEVLLDNADLMQKLHVSARTLQRYRNSGKLPFKKINGKIFYYESDIHKFIEEHTISK